MNLRPSNFGCLINFTYLYIDIVVQKKSSMKFKYSLTENLFHYVFLSHDCFHVQFNYYTIISVFNFSLLNISHDYTRKTIKLNKLFLHEAVMRIVWGRYELFSVTFIC